MPNTERRWTENARQYHGEDEAAPLVDWLNYPLDPTAANYQVNKESQAHIAQILDWLAEMAAADETDVEKCFSLRDRINEALRECAMVPKVDLVRAPGGLSATLDLQPAPGSRYADAPMEYGKTYELLGGHHQILRLVNIWRAGNIGKLRRCKGCGKFLYKRFSNQATCGGSSRCREAAYKRSPEWKAERNARLRKQYAQKLAGIVRER